MDAKQSKSEYIFKEEPTGFKDGFNTESERENKDDLLIFWEVDVMKTFGDVSVSIHQKNRWHTEIG